MSTMTMPVQRAPIASLVLAALTLTAAPATAEKKYDPGASDKEIRIGNVVPYSGPWADYGMTGKALAAVFEQVNENGGIGGRKVKFVSVDGAGDSKKSLEAARKLVEEEPVLLLVGVWGGGPNRAIRPYLNERKVPQLFVASSEETFADPAHYPWTMGFYPSRRTEGQGYVRTVLKTKPAAKIAVLAPDDEDGTACVEGIREALGDKAKSMLVKEARFRASDEASVDAAIAVLKESGADVFLNMATGKPASRAIRAAFDAGWHPTQFVPGAAMSIGGVLEPVNASPVIVEDDVLVGGPGDDRLDGGPGNDTFVEGGNDTAYSPAIAAGSGNDVLNGGAGENFADYAGRAAALSPLVLPCRC